MTEREFTPERAKFFTPARKFVVRIGKLPDGTRIPGGPYSLAQGVVALVTVVLGLLTRTMWSTGNMLVDYLIVIVIMIALTIAAGFIPTQKRNLATVGIAALGAVSSPVAGRRNGRKVLITSAHQVRCDAVIDWGVDDGVATDAPSLPVEEPRPQIQSVPEVEPAAVVPAPQPRAVSGVERLLQQTRAK